MTSRGHRLTCNLSRRRSLLAGQLALRRHLERVRDLVPDVRHEHVQTFALAAAGATLEAEPVVHDAVSSAGLELTNQYTGFGDPKGDTYLRCWMFHMPVNRGGTPVVRQNR